MSAYATTLAKHVWRGLSTFCTARISESVVNAPTVKFYSSSMKAAKQSVNGVDLFYQQTGTGKHAVLLLPGALGSGRTDFGPQLESLNKEHFTVVSWDPRGYGNSRPPERDFPLNFFERDAKDAVDLMLALDFKQFSLLGWSDGGMTALVAAARNPSLVRKLVVWGANSYVTEEDMKIYNTSEIRVCRCVRRPCLGLRTISRLAGIRDVSTWSSRLRKQMEEMYGEQGFPKLWGAWVDSMGRFAQRPNGSVCLEVLPLVSCPTLIIHGEKDPVVPSIHPQYLLKHIRGSRLHVMPEGKHNLHLRFAAEFNQLVEEFLSE